jgi:hypothetical protein
MKMKDLNEAFGDPDYGLKNVGRELDNDERGMKKGFDKDPIVLQLGKVIDSRSNPNPVTTVTTDDGEQVKIGPNMATAIQGLLKGQMGEMKPMARERLQDMAQTSKGLKHLMQAKTGKELVQLAQELIGMKDMEKQVDKSIY